MSATTEDEKRERSAETRRRFLEARAKRSEIATEYSEQLLSELGVTLRELPASKLASFQTAVSCYTECVVLFERFLEGRTVPRDMSQLATIRRQLRVALRDLKLVARDEEDDQPTEKPESLEEFCARVKQEASQEQPRP